MPYTQEELQNVDFYTAFVEKKLYSYLGKLAKAALNLFRKRDTGALISYEDISSGLGIEDATFSSYGSAFENALSRAQVLWKYQNMLTDPAAIEAYEESLAGASAGNPPQIPPIPATSQIFDYIRSLSFSRSKKLYPKNITSNNLEKIIDRSITELSKVSFAETLPEGITNGSVVTNEFADDTRKWLIENNQKRIFPDLETFFGSGVPFNAVKPSTMEQLNRIPDGEPAE